MKTDLTPKQRKRLKAKVKEILAEEKRTKARLDEVIRSTLYSLRQSHDVTQLQSKIVTALQEAHDRGAALAKQHVETDLDALLPPPTKKSSNTMMMVAAAATLAGFYTRGIYRQLLGPEPETLEYAVRQTLKEAQWVLDRTAVTTTYEAYNSTLTDLIKEARKAAGGTIDGEPAKTEETQVLRWSAELDEATCHVCARLDGRTWPLDAPIEPPPVHPNCRCILEVVDR